MNTPTPLGMQAQHLPWQRLGAVAQAWGHTLDQPAVISGVWRQMGRLGALGAGLLVASDIARAERPEQKKNVVVQDALVLGATALGTTWATKKWMVPELPELKATAADLADLAKRHTPEVMTLLRQAATKTPDQFLKIIDGISGQTHLPLGQRLSDLKKALPTPEPEGFMESVKEMGAFFTVGGVSVLSGLAGGIAANRATKAPKGATPAMIKEGLFQFIANIALCAVGASAGLAAIEKLKMGNRFARTGIIMAGLSVGIVGGGRVANWLGRTVINPVFDRLQGAGNPATGATTAPSANAPQRRVGFSDAILHLDDAPTALALAGVEVIKPFIPLFFMYSGYRTGAAGRATASTPADMAHSSGFSSVTAKTPAPQQEMVAVPPGWGPVLNRERFGVHANNSQAGGSPFRAFRNA
jgi:hypothetical protein